MHSSDAENSFKSRFSLNKDKRPHLKVGITWTLQAFVVIKPGQMNWLNFYVDVNSLVQLVTNSC